MVAYPLMRKRFVSEASDNMKVDMGHRLPCDRVYVPADVVPIRTILIKDPLCLGQKLESITPFRFI